MCVIYRENTYVLYGVREHIENTNVEDTYMCYREREHIHARSERTYIDNTYIENTNYLARKHRELSGERTHI
jgi:hypothetical protein